MAKVERSGRPVPTGTNRILGYKSSSAISHGLPGSSLPRLNFELVGYRFGG